MVTGILLFPNDKVMVFLLSIPKDPAIVKGIEMVLLDKLLDAIS
ncbi:hypothetical protein [Neobacillus niacini]